MEVLQGYEVRDVIDEGPRAALARARSRGVDVLLRYGRRGDMTRADLARWRFGFELARSVAGVGVARPLALETARNGVALVLEDAGMTTLRRWIDAHRDGARPVDAVRVAASVAKALAHLHGRGVTHKGVDPRNILVDAKTLEIQLTGFEVSTRLAREAPRVTSLDGVEGDLAYMSPEQTGRMNRGLDYRTDLYSLGVVVYEMLTGATPFAVDDPVALVHAHIAVTPRAPHAVRPEVPTALSDVALRLLAKNAEDRYQSAAGLAADLHECARQLAATGLIEGFVAGAHDAPATFQVPQRLYGRDVEQRCLLDAFDRASAGAAELMLVSGYSGVGKSALVHEVQKPLVRDRGYFAEGKYDALQSTPYGALIEAFQGLIRQILGEREARVTAWRERLREALGAHGRVVTDVIPEVELLVGPQPAVPEQGPTATQNRFNAVFARFIEVFAKAEHPLCLFLDDLQWADVGSLNLLSHLMRSSGARHLLLIGAYRDNEVGEAHPLMNTLAELRKAGSPVGSVALRPLVEADVDELVSDALGGRRDDGRELARVVFEKTAGNPFFVGQFLSSLHARGLLAFDAEQGRWTWRPEAVRQESITENVAALVTGRIHTLSEDARDAVRLGACCEGAFDLSTVAALLNADAEKVASDLWTAVSAGLLVPVGDGYKYVSEHSDETPPARYRFAHDRVHEAAYALIAEDERPSWHLRLGRLWRAALAHGDREVNVFAVVNQLNLGRSLITEPDERRDLARLNLDAATRARDATAYASASQWLAVGCELLGADHLADDALARDTFRARAECDYLLGRFDEAGSGFARVLDATASPSEKRVIYSRQLALFESRGSYADLFEYGRKALRVFDVEVPPDAELQAAFGAELGALMKNTAGRTADDLAKLPELTDPSGRARVQLIAELIHFGSYANPMLFMFLAARLTNLSIENGHAPGSAIGYVGYAMVLAGAFNDYASAYAYGRLALDLADRFDEGVTLVACRFMGHLFVNPWRAPLSDTIAGIDDVYGRATEVGALTFVGLAGMQGVLLRLVHGDELDATTARARAQVAHQSKLNQIDIAFFIAGFWRAMNRLTLDTTQPDDPKWLDDAEVRKGIGVVPAWIAIYNITLQMAAYILGDLDEAASLGEATLPLVPTIFGFMIEAEFRFYDALTRIARGAPAEGAEAWRKTLDEHLAKLSLWATQCPANFAHRDLLARAELAQLEGRAADAIDLYDQAIDAAATADGRAHDLALAHELAGRFHQRHGRRSVARAFLLRARTLYAQWGADAKVAELDRAHPDVAARSSDGRATATTSASLDLTAALRASQALSSEIVLSKLLRTLMVTMLEAAGAQRGHLILLGDTPSVVQLDPGAGNAEPVTTPGSYQDHDDLATDVVRYVERTRERIVLGDASRAGQFRGDPYVTARQPRSVLCMPVIRSKELVGVVYLENNLVADAFTAERCEVLDLLAAQAAISLENARLYDTLDSRVRERTAALHASNEELSRVIRQMRAMQRQLITQEKLASLGALTSGIAHEIKNPLNFVNNIADGVVSLTEDLESELAPARSKLGAAVASSVDELIDELRETAKKISEHGRRADRIVGGMLEHARASGGERTPADLARLVAEHRTLAWQSFKNQNPRSTISLEGELAAMPPVPVIAQDLGRVIVNLVNNACYSVVARQKRSGPEFKPTVRVTTRDLGDRVEIRVWDNGLGVSPDLREKIFHPFFTTKPAGEGTGLGLSISHDIVAQGHGGTLTVESDEGQWAEFIVTLPRAVSDASTAN